MEAQLIRCFKNLISEILVSKATRPDQVIDNFLEKSELVISPRSRDELVNHMQCCIAMLDIPE